MVAQRRVNQLSTAAETISDTLRAPLDIDDPLQTSFVVVRIIFFVLPLFLLLIAVERQRRRAREEERESREVAEMQKLQLWVAVL